jgi:3-methyladenine DNA glycosylase/8-oxoguanine DNA glycosylase
VNRALDGREPSARPLRELAHTARHILNLDEDLSDFYAAVADDPELAWAATGAGRMLLAPTVFEAVVKTMCTPITTR